MLNPHAIMISFHLQGHIIPFVNLAIKLASKGFIITFVHTEVVHHKIAKAKYNTTEIDIFTEARKSGLNINYTTISDCFPVEFNRSANFDQFLKSYLYDFPGQVDKFVGRLVHSSPSDTFFLIADTFCVWPAKIAKKHNLVNVSFWTEPALVFSLYYHLETLRKNGHVPAKGLLENVHYIPGIKSVNTKDFMSYLQDSELTLMHEIIFLSFDEVKKADFVLCNTVHEFEKDVISALQENQPFYAVGPLFSSDNVVPHSLLPESDCTDWLKGKPPGSVLYVSFGSLATIDKHVILEIAYGLVLSEVTFIWVLRPGIVGSKDGDVLPLDFQEIIKAGGLIVPWCTQRLVLSDPAIGAFLTHCGWNSTLESIWSGVPMICYPLLTDQITNRKLIVEDWKIGINLCDEMPITREGVAKKIKHMMSSETSSYLRQETETARKKVQAALDMDGSTAKNFDCFIENLKVEISKKSKVL